VYDEALIACRETRVRIMCGQLRWPVSNKPPAL